MRVVLLIGLFVGANLSGRRRLVGVEPVRDGAIGTDKIGHQIGQQQLGDVERQPGEHGIALVDQVQNRPDDERDEKRASWHAVRNRITPDLPDHLRRRSFKSSDC